MIPQYAIGGININGIGYAQNLLASSMPLLNSSSESQSVLGSEELEIRKGIRASGTSIRPLLYYGFFSVIVLSIASTLINNTQFTVIALKIANIQETYQSKELSEIKDALESGSKQALIMASIIIVAGLALATFIGRKLSGQINRLSTIMYALANGNHRINVTPDSKVGVELASMYDAVNVFKEHAQEVEHLKQQEKEMEIKRASELKNTLSTIAEVLDQQIIKIFENVERDQKAMLSASNGIDKLSLQLKKDCWKNLSKHRYCRN